MTLTERIDHMLSRAREYLAVCEAAPAGPWRVPGSNLFCVVQPVDKPDAPPWRVVADVDPDRWWMYDGTAVDLAPMIALSRALLPAMLRAAIGELEEAKSLIRPADLSLDAWGFQPPHAADQNERVAEAIADRWEGPLGQEGGGDA